jgi:hypothetical protein
MLADNESDLIESVKGNSAGAASQRVEEWTYYLRDARKTALKKADKPKSGATLRWKTKYRS